MNVFLSVSPSNGAADLLRVPPLADFSKRAPSSPNFGGWMGGWIAFAVMMTLCQIATFYYFTVILTQRGSL